MSRRWQIIPSLMFATALIVISLISSGAEGAGIPGAEGRRLEVLFLGSINKHNHDPIARFRVIRKALGPKGINFTYSETLDALTPQNLARYEVLLIFANHETIAVDQQKALLEFSRKGGGCVLLHCAAGCFRKSNFDQYVTLLGAQFKSHKKGVFRAKIIQPDHPIMKGWEGFECWDESYVHQRHGAGREVLQMRDDEPWTWVRGYGEGRVFYTASGHDHRCWGLPQYQDLIHRAVRWTAGEDKAGLVDKLGLPKLSYRPAAVPKDPDNPVGTLNEIQDPLSPEESLKLAQIPAGFELKVFAREPMIVNPIAIGWDHRGRLWVVEAFDYPHKIGTEKPGDRIKILEDADRDGVADKVTIFAEGLNICTSVLPMSDGAIATDGKDVVYLVDKDGDDKVDERRVIWSGIGLRDTHACTSNLRYGFDGWIYATVGYSGIDTVVAGKVHKSSQGVFRFREDGSDFEIIQNTSNNTWGLSFTEEGDLVGSTANGNPSWYLTIPNRYFEMVGRKPQQVARADQEEPLYPITGDYFQNNPKEQCSSGSGHAIYTARRFPESWWNKRALICEPPMHLVAAPRHENRGDSFSTTRFESNLYASADAWSAPVAAEVGPDGAVWIADWYNPICNHNPFRPHHKRGAGNAHVNDDRDREHGRIYRIYPSGSKDDPFPNLLSAEGCIEGLKHSNLLWRLAARRLSRKHLDPNAWNSFVVRDSIAAAANSRLLGRSQELFRELFESEETSSVRLLHDRSLHPLVRKAAALRLVEAASDPSLGAELAKLLVADQALQTHRHLHDAIRLAVLKHPEGFVRFLIDTNTNPDQPALKRTVANVLTRFESDKSILSGGLLALARNSNHVLAKRVTTAAGAPKVVRAPGQQSAGAKRGEQVYFTCVACHQPDGRGLTAAFPALAKSPRVLGNPAVPVKIVLKGLQGPLTSQGKKFVGVMPGHETLLSDQQIADVLTYVRNSWENEADEVDVATVKKIREEVKDRKTPWTEEELN
ncbi:MAG: ThuA domain-containing protein [Roseibacillus sp.]|nr:ThuA domain-containing protein [Roseibacillus sp.]